MKYIHSIDAVAGVTGGQTVILHKTSGVYFELNDSATLIWGALNREQTLDQLIELVASTFEVDMNTCKQDVTGVLQTLVETNLVLEVSEDAAKVSNN